MPLMPKRVKYRKSQRGKVKGKASRGNRVVFGDFGLQAMEGGWLSAQAIEAGRVTVTHAIRGEGRLYIRVFPHKSITAIPAETRMGKGKGEPIQARPAGSWERVLKWAKRRPAAAALVAVSSLATRPRWGTGMP